MKSKTETQRQREVRIITEGFERSVRAVEARKSAVEKLAKLANLTKEEIQALLA